MNNHFISLKSQNTFSVDCTANIYIHITDQEQLIPLTEKYFEPLTLGHFYLLGDGSNTLFIDQHIDLVIKSGIKGITFNQTNEAHIVDVGAGENWHEFVTICLDKGIFGLENLALIPGSIGAAPVQNIGAYGVEFSKYCQHVHWFDFTSKKTRIISAADCQFGYRDSIFKQALKNKGMITKVTFCFPKNWQACLDYNGVCELPKTASPIEIMERVIALRKSKLPDPNVLPNAGSFFKNPIVTESCFEALLKQYPALPFYPQPDKTIKLAAGWLIEQAGLKGKKNNKVSVHDNQALVLVNHADGSGQDLVNLAKIVQGSVYKKFGIHLSPEVRFVDAIGECDADDLIQEV